MTTTVRLLPDPEGAAVSRTGAVASVQEGQVPETAPPGFPAAPAAAGEPAVPEHARERRAASAPAAREQEFRPARAREFQAEQEMAVKAPPSGWVQAASAAE